MDGSERWSDNVAANSWQYIKLKLICEQHDSKRSVHCRTRNEIRELIQKRERDTFESDRGWFDQIRFSFFAWPLRTIFRPSLDLTILLNPLYGRVTHRWMHNECFTNSDFEIACLSRLILPNLYSAVRCNGLFTRSGRLRLCRTFTRRNIRYSGAL